MEKSNMKKSDDNTVNVVIHLHKGVLYDVAVYKNEAKAQQDYETRVTEIYGSLDDEQCGNDLILFAEAEIIE